MVLRIHSLDVRLDNIDRLLAAMRWRAGRGVGAQLERWRSDVAALRFHLADSPHAHPPLVAILGGTGTGKSTLVNRLLDASISATSFRRTFTSGAVAIARDARSVPPGWLGIEHVVASEQDLPARGQADRLIIVPAQSELAGRVTLIDTPDLDGDQPAHHAQADRVFRWAQAVLFLVTPEKYQMTELLPYYRLARRYAIGAMFAMNKCEDDSARQDWAEQLGGQHGFAGRNVYAIPRDDAAYDPPAESNLSSLRSAIASARSPEGAEREVGLGHRAADLMDRLSDQIIAPLRDARDQVERTIAALRALEAPPASVDVNPVTQQLQRRMQERSILYLMGPQRMIDRVRQAPAMLARLPRATWDWIMKDPRAKANDLAPESIGATVEAAGRQLPDFRALLVDQMTVVQSRLDDIVRSAPLGSTWIDADAAGYTAAKIDAAQAGEIAEQEITDLRTWLEQRWNASPRDTAVIQRLVKHLPGGEKLTQWSEAAPYLLAIIVATHHAFLGPIDLIVIGGFSLATWVMEKLSNEVASRTRSANRRIADRFARLVHEQIAKTVNWIDRQAPTDEELESLERAATEVSESIGA